MARISLTRPIERLTGAKGLNRFQIYYILRLQLAEQQMYNHDLGGHLGMQ